MRYSKVLAWGVLAAGVMVAGAEAKAEEPYRESRDVRHDERDLRGDYARVNAMRYDIAARRARLDEDVRCGRFREAARERRVIEREEAALHAQYRDIRHDRADLYRDRW